MNFQEFAEKFAEQYEDLAPENLTSETKFREVGEYSSLTALMILSMIDEEYEVTLTGDDMRSVETVGELYELIKSRL